MTATKTKSHAHDDDSIKETFESVIMAFVLAFVFRAYVVEAFVIPTGSMAPTLLGAHMNVTCEQCGYRFVVEWPHVVKLNGRDTPMPLANSIDVRCVMCRHDNAFKRGTHPRAGDRILVHKYIYSVSEPRRWDVVVFKNPQGAMGRETPFTQANFIKRLVGLPKEDLWIVDGNIYTRPHGSDQWQIARKTLQPKAQKAAWQPVYHSRYIRLDDDDWQAPWLGEPAEQWQIARRRTYLFEGQGEGTLRFDFGLALADYELKYPYNQFNPMDEPEPIEDVIVGASFLPQRDGLTIKISTTAGLDDQATKPWTLTATINADGQASLIAIEPATDQIRELATGQVSAPKPGKAMQVALWYVDQQLSLWVDGKRELTWSFDLEMDAILARLHKPTYPTINIKVAGSPVQMSNVKVSRDIYYSSSQQNRSQVSQGVLRREISRLRTSARLVTDDQGRLLTKDDLQQVYLVSESGTPTALGMQGPDRQLISRKSQQPVRLVGSRLKVTKQGRQVQLVDGRLRVMRGEQTVRLESSTYNNLMTLWAGQPIQLDADHFFCLGDNSPRSSDGRFWASVNPWIEKRMFDPDREEPITGIVPRPLMMGRAFFVYFPAPRSWHPKKRAFVPAFGEMRFIH